VTLKNKRTCKNCGRDFNANPKWDYELCKECSIALYEKTEKYWFTEVLGFSEALDKFLPPLPRALFNIALKKYAAIGQYDLGEAYTDKGLAEELAAAGLEERQKLLKKVDVRSAKCGKCDEVYTVDGIWQYNICKKCAVQEVIDWRAYWARQVPGIGTAPIGFDIPPIEVSKYHIDH